MARDGAVYVGIEGGMIIPQDIDVDLDLPLSVPYKADNDKGYDIDVVLGYDFGGFRLEAEAGRKQWDIDTLTRNPTTGVGGPGGPGPVIPGPTSVDFSGADFRIWSGMVNALADFGGNEGVGFSVGGGLGIAKTKVRMGEDDQDWFHGKGSKFAWQLLGEVRVPVSRAVDVGLKYRYFNTRLDEDDLVGATNDFKIKTHSIMAALKVNFGGAEPAPPPPPPPPAPPPPPPPPPAPPPPPPPPAQQCNSGPYIVFFDWDKADITPEAATILNNAVTAYGYCNNVPIMLAGYTDRSGSPQYNLELSARRNASVRAYLVNQGIPDSVITSKAFGEANPRVPTADGVRELQNRRVEITYGPGSGN